MSDIKQKAIQVIINKKLLKQEIKARGGRILAITTVPKSELGDAVDHVIQIPSTLSVLTPLLSVIPLQLLAYHMAVTRGCNVDQPRNLAKSVTVE